MNRVYFEVSSINEAVDKGIDPEIIKQKLSLTQSKAIVGTHTIFEIAKCFLVPESIGRGKELFLFIHGTDPTYEQPIDWLIRQEVAMLRSGVTVLSFLDARNQLAARNEVYNLSHLLKIGP
jgi:hypothetical protein